MINRLKSYTNSRMALSLFILALLLTSIALVPSPLVQASSVCSLTAEFPFRDGSNIIGDAVLRCTSARTASYVRSVLTRKTLSGNYVEHTAKEVQNLTGTFIMARASLPCAAGAFNYYVNAEARFYDAGVWQTVYAGPNWLSFSC